MLKDTTSSDWKFKQERLLLCMFGQNCELCIKKAAMNQGLCIFTPIVGQWLNLTARGSTTKLM